MLLFAVAKGNNKTTSSHKLDDSTPTIGQWEKEIGFLQSIAITDDSPILIKHSKFQMIEIKKSEYFGKILLLDGVIQLTERDADSYNEMMAHIPMFQHGNPKRVLVIGGGDGYVLSEVKFVVSIFHACVCVASVLFFQQLTFDCIIRWCRHYIGTEACEC